MTPMAHRVLPSPSGYLAVTRPRPGLERYGQHNGNVVDATVSISDAKYLSHCASRVQISLVEHCSTRARGPQARV